MWQIRIALTATVVLFTNGACAPDIAAKICGGFAGAGCAKGEYCQFPLDAQCGAADQTGTCAATPHACDTLYAPVCGCDGKTYGNTCAAAAAGVSVSRAGTCP